jgi:hypothetical protein
MTATLKLLTVDCAVETPGADQCTFKSSHSLLGYDIVIFDPFAAHIDLVGKQYGAFATVNYDFYQSLKVLVNHRREEFEELLDLGKVVVCLVPPPTHISDGSSSFEVADALGVIISTTTASGQNLESKASGPLRLFYDNSKGTLRYFATLQEPQGDAFLVIAGTQRVVGSYNRIGGGHLLFTPHFTDKGLSFVAGIVAWYKAITRTVSHEPEPSWSTIMSFDLAKREQTNVHQLDEQLRIITAQHEEAVQALDELLAWKRLIYATGDELEEQVGKAFELFEFSVQPGQPGRDDFIVEADGMPAVVEVKGVTGSATEANAAQLEKWTSTYKAEHDGAAAKGILVVNAFRDKPLPQRPQPVFPDQMLPYSERREHCLVSGLQLLGMVLEVLADITAADNVRQRLMTTKGRLEGYDDYRTFLAETQGTTSGTGT